ncbi:UPF0686 protein C11orf1 homolog [Choloepus didactylus]|uniref:UPF0686 protein C11orf1 homolog n=1 Tax=Choloepus didactylus TaxID=27675 RepID=UPI00189E4AE6|nr:UPF0686 protein C11orf1 homolog [Choloepus didactylus]
MALSHCVCCPKFPQRQSLTYFLRNPHYGSFINADGHAEVWTDWNDMSKFFQYEWRCTTNENAYLNHTLMGNWNQERYDLRNIMQSKPLPTQYGHYFETTYNASYKKCHFQPIDVSECLTGSQYINLNWILLFTNAQKSQLI